MYIKVAVGLLVSIFATREVLHALGSVDYGIFNLVGSIIVMFNVVNLTMVTTTQRFIAYAEGGNDLVQKRTVFRCSMRIHAILGVLIVAVMMLFLLFLFDRTLNIPPERLDAAKNVCLLVICTTFFSVISVPFDAEIIAHEEMHITAILGICESLLKMICAFSMLVIKLDRLVYWGGALLGIAVLLFSFKFLYCRKRYTECRKLEDEGGIDMGATMKRIFSFAGWAVLYSISSVVAIQSVSYLLNIFFGPRLNAARGIANMLTGETLILCGTMMSALAPALTKQFSSGEKSGMISLTLSGCKISAFLSMLIGLPLIFEIREVLRVWLVEIPDYTIEFARLSILEQIIASSSMPLVTVINADGRIRDFEIAISVTYLIRIPLIYLLFKNGFSPLGAYYVTIAMVAAMCCCRVYFAQKLCDIKVVDFIGIMLARVMPFVVLSLFAGGAVVLLLPSSLPRVALTSAAMALVMIITMWLTGLSGPERSMILQFLSRISGKLRKSGAA